MNRFDVCEAHQVYAWDYHGSDGVGCPKANEYERRLHRMRFRPAANLCLERLSPEAKDIYAGLVRRHQGLQVAAFRLCRRARVRWPGTITFPLGHIGPRHLPVVNVMASALDVLDLDRVRAALESVAGEYLAR